MSARRFFIAFVIALILSSVISYIILCTVNTTPSILRHQVILDDFRDCIWYGYYEGQYDPEHDYSKEKEIVSLPDSLFSCAILAQKYSLKELDHFTDDCDLIYNPNGLKEKSWVLIINSNDIEGNLILWSDKKIEQKKGMMEKTKEMENLKYYSISL